MSTAPSSAREIVGVLGPNGAGKTTLFEMIAGSNVPTGGRIVVAGQDMQRVRYRQRDRLAIHYHQSYQVRRFAKTLAGVHARGSRTAPIRIVHLFDEPQFNTQDGYIGFMLDFFRRLRGEGRLVFVCLHPTAAFQLEILREICERFLFVSGGACEAIPTSRRLQPPPTYGTTSAASPRSRVSWHRAGQIVNQFAAADAALPTCPDQ